LNFIAKDLKKTLRIYTSWDVGFILNEKLKIMFEEMNIEQCLIVDV
jgi:hypothetical protein